MSEEKRTFQQELESLINLYSMENGSDTPDFLLAEYMMDSLRAFNKAVSAREKWYGHSDKTHAVLSGEELPNTVPLPKARLTP